MEKRRLQDDGPAALIGFGIAAAVIAFPSLILIVLGYGLPLAMLLGLALLVVWGAWSILRLMVGAAGKVAGIRDEKKRERKSEQEQREREAQVRQRADDKNRRATARARLRLYFDAHEKDIAESFGRERFDKFCTEFLTEDHDAIFVEEQAQQLLNSLRRIVERNDPEPRQRQERDREAAQRERARIETEAARMEIVTYYRQHDELRDLYPFSMLQAFMHSEMHDGIEPAKAWLACRTQIAELQRLMENRRERAERRAQNRSPSQEDIQREIQELLHRGMSPADIAAQLSGILSERLTPEDMP